jgi:hypothetical protein
MKKVIRLTEDDLNKIVKRVINENNRVYGGSNIEKLYNNLKDDEYVHLDDTSGELSGDVVSKIEYVKRMLKSAIREENWSKVENTILFIDAMMKP